eukprot:TRINITY_DN17038_c0_g1_i2.p1 TRINITY_DN17038_c0_g1~~TRINITY_DN17038_c0_g1_i2.p1  ORF type:complete len:440 (-),score=98.82 TRINITY_DN17038_c0_g1_i2:25-1317(-)
MAGHGAQAPMRRRPPQRCQALKLAVVSLACLTLLVETSKGATAAWLRLFSSGRASQERSRSCPRAAAKPGGRSLPPLPDLPPLPPLSGEELHAESDTSLPPLPPLPPLTGAAAPEPLTESDASLPPLPPLPPLPGTALEPHTKSDASLPPLPPLPPLPGTAPEPRAENGASLPPLPPLPGLAPEPHTKSDASLPPLPPLPPLPGTAPDAASDASLPPLPPLPGTAPDAASGAPLPPLPPLSGEVEAESQQLQPQSRPRQSGMRRPSLFQQVMKPGMTARAWLEDASRRDKPRDWWALPPQHDGGPRVLSWEEVCLDFLPLGATVRGVVVELRPYGAFIGLVFVGMDDALYGEDSLIRGFCPRQELIDVYGEIEEGNQIAVKLLSLDPHTRRLTVSAAQAEPPWPEKREKVLQRPSFYEDDDDHEFDDGFR